MRPSLYSAPADSDLLKDSGLVWSTLITPLSPVCEDNGPVPLVDFGSTGPIRCKRCRAYLNPFVFFTDAGKKWKCNFCEIPNEVSAQYFCNLDANGNRRDLQDRAELSKGSVEYDLQNVSEYAFCGNKTKSSEQPATDFKPCQYPLNYVICIDISVTASALLPSVIQAVKDGLAAMAATYPSDNLFVSFITFASTVHFYDFSRKNIPIFMVADINDIFVPLPFSRVCWLSIHRDAGRIAEFFDRLPSYAQDIQETQCCLGSALSAATLVLAESGGRVMCFFTSYPKVGMGAIKPREEYKLYGTEN